MMATGGPEARTSELGEVEIVDGQRAPTAMPLSFFLGKLCLSIMDLSFLIMEHQFQLI
jgi:hypothetical protein